MLNIEIWSFKSTSSLCKMPKFHLISWYGNFLERHSFRIVLGESPEFMRKLCLSTKCRDQEIGRNYGIFAMARTKVETSNLPI